MASLIAFGDSNTYGIGDPIGGGWANRLRTTMIGRVEDPEQIRRSLVIHNLARYSMTLPEIVASLPATLADRDRRGRLITAAMVGFSESVIDYGQTGPVVPMDQFENSLVEYSSICKWAADHYGFPIVRLFVESPPIDLSRPRPYNPGYISSKSLQNYQTTVFAHALETGATFIPTHQTLLYGPEDPWSQDGIHPSPAGHLAISRLVLHEVDSIMDKD